MAGLEAGYALKQLGISLSCYDKNLWAGGHTRSIEWERVVLDEGSRICISQTGSAHSLASNILLPPSELIPLIGDIPLPQHATLRLQMRHS
jgi:protoporphyrinogen oxidase